MVNQKANWTSASLLGCLIVGWLATTSPLRAQTSGTWGPGGNGVYTNGYVGVGIVPIQSAFNVYSNTTGGGTLFNVDGGPAATGYRFVLSDGGVARFRIAPIGTTIIDAGGSNPALIVNYGGANPIAAQINGGISVSGDVTVAGNIAAKYQDVAEWVPATMPLLPGTVVVVDGDSPNRVAPSTHSYDTRVAGVISAHPGLILGEAGDGKEKVATTGRVKVRVDATKHPIKIGDLLVTSDKEGLAMVSVPVKLAGIQMHRPGTLIGKALEPLASGQKEILVLLSMQ